MDAVEHMIAWIESSRPHYDRLIALEQNRKGAFQRGKVGLATHAFNLVLDAYSEATRGGDMFADDWTPSDLLNAAVALLAWELEQ